MTRSLAPKPRVKPARKRIPVDPDAVHHFRCSRCNRLVWAHCVVSECQPCISHAVRVFGLGPVQGEISGC